VHDRDSFLISFPNDGRLIPLRPGMYIASGSASSTVEGFAHPKFVNAEALTWGVPSA
jgi:hypothetical protein